MLGKLAKIGNKIGNRFARELAPAMKMVPLRDYNRFRLEMGFQRFNSVIQR
jgi:hypothetical protein